MKEKREDRESAYVMDRCGEAKRLLHSLPYRLTGAQLRALKEVYGDLAGRKIMNRLIQGDVGSGKTIIAVLALLSWLATRRLRDVPGPLQNAAEMAVEKLQGFYGGILGPANARRYFPMMATFFIFIVVSNYIGLLPGAGQVFTVPTATLSVTAGLAIIAFCMTHTVGIQRRGLGGYLKSFIKPFLLMLPLNLIEQIVRPFSLALRLYGNLYGEEMVTHELGNLFPLVLPLLMQVLSLLFCLIQAVVFTMLLSIYIEEAIEE